MQKCPCFSLEWAFEIEYSLYHYSGLRGEFKRVKNLNNHSYSYNIWTNHYIITIFHQHHNVGCKIYTTITSYMHYICIVSVILLICNTIVACACLCEGESNLMRMVKGWDGVRLSHYWCRLGNRSCTYKRKCVNKRKIT